MNKGIGVAASATLQEPRLLPQVNTSLVSILIPIPTPFPLSLPVPIPIPLPTHPLARHQGTLSPMSSLQGGPGAAAHSPMPRAAVCFSCLRAAMGILV